MGWTADASGGALRSLLRARGFALPAFLILTLGIGATTGMFTVVNGVLLEPLDLPDADRLVSVCETHPEALSWCGVVGVANTWDLSRQSSTLQGLGTIRQNTLTIRDEEGATNVTAGLVTPGLLDLLEVPPILGRVFAPDEMGPDHDGVAVLSHALWAQRYGEDTDVLGRSLDLEGTPATIIGVMPEGFDVPGAEGSALWKPVPWDLTSADIRGWRGVVAVGRLADGRTLDEAGAELETLYASLARLHDEARPPWSVHVRPLLHQIVGSRTRTTLLLFLAGVGLLLAIGILNVANLLLVRGARRRRDFAIRHALGAGRNSLVRQVLAESLILSGVSAAAGLFVAWVGVRGFVALAPEGFPRLGDLAMDGGVVLFAALVSLASSAAFGVIPALRTTETGTAASLRSSRASTDRRGNRLRRTLVIAELSLSLVLLAAAGLLTRSFLGFTSWEMGFEPDGLVFAQAFLPRDRYPEDPDAVAAWTGIEEQLAAIPGVTAATSGSGVPLRSSPEGALYRVAGQESLPESELPTGYFFDIGPGYFGALGMSLRSGREFTPEDGWGAPAVAMVNETFAARAWPAESALGKTVWADFRGETMTVVGVVEDLPPVTPGAAVQPVVYWPNRQWPRGASMLVVRSQREPGAVADALRGAVERVDPSIAVFDRGTVASLFRQELARPRFNMALIGAFALVALLLAALGTYGVLSYLVAERTREFGIRLALGSSRRRILETVMREGLSLALVGAVLGVLGALASARLLSGVIYGVEPGDPATLAVVSLLLIALTAVACAAPAFRASRVDPVRLLSSE